MVNGATNPAFPRAILDDTALFDCLLKVIIFGSFREFRNGLILGPEMITFGDRNSPPGSLLVPGSPSGCQCYEISPVAQGSQDTLTLTRTQTRARTPSLAELPLHFFSGSEISLFSSERSRLGQKDFKQGKPTAHYLPILSLFQ